MPYVLEGQRWASQPISWDFAGSTLPGDASTPFSNAVTQQDAQAVVASAFEAWSRAAGLQFVYAPADSAAVDIRIGWGAFAASSSDTELGETDYNYYTATNDFAPDVLVRLLDPSTSPLADQDGAPTYTAYDVTLEQVVLHEIGHAIGLAHDTADADAIMYPYASTENRALAAPDIAGAQAIYGPPGSSVIVAGADAQTVSGSLSGAPATVFGGSGALDFAGNAGLVVLGTGSAVVQDGTVTVFAGSGALAASNNPHGEFILGGGTSSISGGSAGSTDIVFGGSGVFTYAGAAESASVLGGAGSDTVTGGAGGGFYGGGAAGNNLLTATGIGTVLVGGGGNDILRAAAPGFDELVAGSGNETLVGAGGGTNRFFLGTGHDQINLGPGASQLVTGAGTATILGQGGASALFGGTGGADLYVEQPGSTMTVTGFRPGLDQIQGGTPISVSAGTAATVLRFADGATVTLNGLDDPSGGGLFS